MSVRVGVCGLGRMGARHARALADVPGATLVGVADVRAEARRGFGCAAFEGVDALLDEARPDAVVVAVPAASHADIACRLLARGVHVLVEKPMATREADAERMAVAAERSGAILAVGHVERFNPAVEALERELARGAVGSLRAIQTRRMGPRPDGRELGVLLDLGVHDADLVLRVGGTRFELGPAVVRRGPSGVDVDAVGTMRLTGGVLATVEVGWSAQAIVRELSVVGDEGVLVADLAAQRLARRDGDALVPIACAGADPLRAELADFVRAARGEGAPRVGPDAGARAVRVCAGWLALAK